MATNIDKLSIKLDRLKNIDVNKVLTQACMLVESSAKEKCPVNTGNLRNSITYEINDNVGIVGTNVEYAPYVEFGTGLYSSLGTGRTDVPWRYKDDDGNWHTTSGNHPQPFLGPALEENRETIYELFNEEVKEDIDW